MQTTTTYTTIGSVRGACGHEHRTVEAATRCMLRDMEGCRSQGGYSDRSVRHADGSALTDDEIDACQAVQSGER